MNKSAPKTIDEYLSAVPEDKRAALEHLRQIIKDVCPEAEECISYGMPGFKYHGPLVYFAAFKNHCSLFPAGTSVITAFKDELKPYVITKGSIHFTVEQPLPDELVIKFIKARIKENEAKRKR